MITLHYLAYGSNLHPLRLQERVPSAKVIGTIEIPNRVVNFHKRSKYGSGKCNLIEDDTQHGCHGAIYEIAASELGKLDSAEGPGYIKQHVQTSIGGVSYPDVLVYVAQAQDIDPRLSPYDWYKDMVLAGANYHQFPAEYIAKLAAVPSIPEPNPATAAENAALLLRMKKYSLIAGRPWI